MNTQASLSPEERLADLIARFGPLSPVGLSSAILAHLRSAALEDQHEEAVDTDSELVWLKALHRKLALGYLIQKQDVYRLIKIVRRKHAEKVRAEQSLVTKRGGYAGAQQE